VGTEDEVLGLRNLSMIQFPTAQRELRSALRAWLETRVEMGIGAVSFARQVFLVTNPWQDVARQSVQDAFHHWNKQCAALLWHWWREEPSLIAPLDSILPSDASLSLEGDLISTAPPSISANVREPLLGFASVRRWPRLHAEILAIARDLQATDRLRCQLRYDQEAGNNAGIDYLVSRIPKDELVVAAISLADPQLLKHAAAATVVAPDLFSTLDPAIPMWRFESCCGRRKTPAATNPSAIVSPTDDVGSIPWDGT
jgi:hypothetical protein